MVRLFCPETINHRRDPMLVKTILNQIERFKGFVFGKVSIGRDGSKSRLLNRICGKRLSIETL